MNNIKLKDVYDCVSVCKKCGIKYGYDVPNKFKKKFCGKIKIIPGYKDNGLCPMCDKTFKEKINFSSILENDKRRKNGS